MSNEEEIKEVSKEEQMKESQEAVVEVMRILAGKTTDTAIDVAINLLIKVSEITNTPLRETLRVVDDAFEKIRERNIPVFRILEVLSDIGVEATIKFEEDRVYVINNDTYFDIGANKWVKKNLPESTDDSYLGMIEEIISIHYLSDKNTHDTLVEKHTKAMIEESKGSVEEDHD